MEEIPKSIIESAAHNDLDAFERIYKATHVYVYNIAFRMAGHKEDAEEITQEVFIKAHSSIKQFKFNSSLTTWIYRITVNTALNKIKQRNRRRERPLNLEDHTPEAPVSRPFETTRHKEDCEELVRQMLESLSPKLRACVVLKDMEGLRYREIAETLNININTVRTRLKRAREILLRKASSKKAARHELF
jgi:RNA polymerase sigma-70 factor (ECF subfamily)